MQFFCPEISHSAQTLCLCVTGRAYTRKMTVKRHLINFRQRDIIVGNSIRVHIPPTRGQEVKLLKRLLPLVFAALLVSSCSSASVEELLSPPRSDGEQTEIYEALRSFTNDDITLKYPRSGQYRSAFVVKNLDGELTDEAIVFYERPNVSDGSSLRMNFLDKQNGKWVSTYDFAATGSEVENVTFRDLGDGFETIVVNYLVQNSSDRSTSVFTYKNGFPEELMSIRNIYAGILDVNGDENDELFTISSGRSSGSQMAGFYGWQDNSFVRLGQTPLSSSLASVKDVSCGSCDKVGTRAVFVDHAFSDGSFSTDALIYSRNYFYLSPAMNGTAASRISNTYTPYMKCSDIDEDGTTEIPSTIPFPDYEELPNAEQVNQTIWYSLEKTGTSIKEKYRSFAGTKGDYMFIFPEIWKDKVTAAVSVSEGIVTFYEYSLITKTTGSVILTIYGAAEGNTAKYENNGELLFLGKSGQTGYSYYAGIGTGRLAPNEIQLNELFLIDRPV